jgi:FdhD protein
MANVDEAPVWIAINGVRRVVLTCSPADPHALGLGHLLSEGWIDRADRIRSIEVEEGPGGCRGVNVHIDDPAVAAAERLKQHLLAHGCGLRHFLDCVAMPQRTPAGPAAAVDFGAVFRSLFAAADAASPAGGVHAAALTDGTQLLHVGVDVARHCAVDRVLGDALRCNAPIAEYGLIATSRISGAIALKAIRANVLWAASRSLATPLARELAAAAGLTLHEQAARRQTRGQQA